MLVEEIQPDQAPPIHFECFEALLTTALLLTKIDLFGQGRERSCRKEFGIFSEHVWNTFFQAEQ